MPIVLQPNVKTKDIDHEQVRSLAESLSIVRPLAEVLYTRGYTQPEKLKAFLYPSEKQISDPFTLQNMQESVKIIQQALADKQKITIYGDYDVDGVCATALLYLALRELKAEVETYLPNRHTEGYGLNEHAIQSLAQSGTKLIITVDCGISAHHEVKIAKQLDMQVIVTDHHELPDTLPDCPIINPKQSHNEQQFKDFCGAGVALKLVTALLGAEKAEKYYDIAAMATVADIVPLIGENRYIVKKGLELINTRPREGIKQLITQSSIRHNPITSTDIAFMLAPRMNAAGRLGQATTSLELLIDDKKAAEHAKTLQDYNVQRQDIESDILRQAVVMAYESGQVRERRILVLASEGWEPGVIGIVASRMTERFNRPCILLSIQDSIATGSGRSIKGIHLFQMLSQFHSLFDKFGGHEMAAGMTLHVNHLDTLINELDAYIKTEINPKVFYPVARYDARARLAEVNLLLCEQLQLLEPCGAGNPIPRFRIDDLKATNIRLIGKNEQHLKASLYDDIIALEAVAFNFQNSNVMLDKQNTYSVISTPMLSTWNNVNSAILKINAVSKNRDLNSTKKLLIEEKDRLVSAFFTQAMYNNNNDNYKNALVFDDADDFIDEMQNCLTEDISGALVLASHPAVCETMLEWVFPQAPRTDICFYQPTDSANGYNTLLLGPNIEKINFQAYRYVFLCDFYRPEYLNYLITLAPHSEFIVFSSRPEELFSKLDAKYTDLSRLTMARIYKTIKQIAGTIQSFTSIDKYKQALIAADGYLDHCLIDFALAVFQELGFITITSTEKVSVVLNETAGQNELTNSNIYNKITNYMM